MDIRVGWETLDKKLIEFYEKRGAYPLKEETKNGYIYRGMSYGKFFGPLLTVSNKQMQCWCVLTIEILEAEIGVCLAKFAARIERLSE